MFDELRLSSAGYIGPPDGFVSGGGDETPPTLESATISSDGTQINLTFDDNTRRGDSCEDACGFSLSNGITMTYAEGDGTYTLVFDLSQTVCSTMTAFTLDYDPGLIEDTDDNPLAEIDAQAVTNSSTVLCPLAEGVTGSGVSTGGG